MLIRDLSSTSSLVTCSFSSASSSLSYDTRSVSPPAPSAPPAPPCPTTQDQSHHLLLQLRELLPVLRHKITVSPSAPSAPPAPPCPTTHDQSHHLLLQLDHHDPHHRPASNLPCLHTTNNNQTCADDLPLIQEPATHPGC